MEIVFERATKHQAKLRLAIFGPSGCGKTYTALKFATGMCPDSICVIDTEYKSSLKYAEIFKFDIKGIHEDKSIDYLIKVLAGAAQKGYKIVIIDSLSHSWQELLFEIDRLAKSKYHGNSWGAWSEGTPKQKKLINAILGSPFHVIATMRSKTEYILETTGKGTMVPKRVGMGPEAGKGIEYEFDMLGEMDMDHCLRITKDRTGLFQDRIIEKPGEIIGRQLIEWLSQGAPPPKNDRDILKDRLDRLRSQNLKDKKKTFDALSDRFSLLSIDILDLRISQLEAYCSINEHSDILVSSDMYGSLIKSLTESKTVDDVKNIKTQIDVFLNSPQDTPFQDDIPWGDENENQPTKEDTIDNEWDNDLENQITKMVNDIMEVSKDLDNQENIQSSIDMYGKLENRPEAFRGLEKYLAQLKAKMEIQKKKT